ncbi:MAG TPA: ABC transporter permease [Anaerolineales bacterium]
MQISNEVYDSAQRPHPLIDEILALVKYKDLLIQFISRALKTRYKRSVLGVAWTMLNPLLMTLVLTLVFSGIFVQIYKLDNFPVYVLSGLMAWQFFSSTTSAAMGEMIWSGSLLNRIYVPKSVFAVSAVGTGLVNLALSLIPLLFISLVLRVKLTPAILVMPLAALLLALFALGVGLLLATAAVYFADMLPVYEVVLMVWMYSSPIIYPVEILRSPLNWLIKLNPMYYLITAFRTPLYKGVVPGWDIWLPAAGFAILAFLVGGLVFTAKSNEYAYRI